MENNESVRRYTWMYGALRVGVFGVLLFCGWYLVAGWPARSNAQERVGVSAVSKIAAAGNYSVVLTKDGSVTCWGALSATVPCTVPTTVAHVVEIRAAPGRIVARRSDKTLVCWGPGSAGCPVNSAYASEGYITIAAGQNISASLTAKTRTLVCAGTARALCRVDPMGMKNLHAGSNRLLYQQADGTLHCIGLYTLCDSVPALDPRVYRIVDFATGTYENVVYVEQRQIGLYAVMCLGKSGTTYVCLKTWNVTDQGTAVAAGGTFFLALHDDGTVDCWPLRIGTFTCSGITTVTDAIAVAAGQAHALVLHRDGSVTGYGANGAGQITVPSFPTYTPTRTRTPSPTLTATRTRTATPTP